MCIEAKHWYSAEQDDQEDQTQLLYQQDRHPADFDAQFDEVDEY